jgi:hypothetical protein
MAHAQKPDFVFRRNGRVHLNWWGSQFSWLLAAEVCASALVMLDTPRSEIVWQYWLPTPFASFPFTSPPVRHRVPSGVKRAIKHKSLQIYKHSIGFQNTYLNLTLSIITITNDILTLNLLMTIIVASPSNASKWQVGFNSAFRGLNQLKWHELSEWCLCWNLPWQRTCKPNSTHCSTAVATYSVCL